MRALSTVLAATISMWLFGCVRFPQMNLREPIYLVMHPSLFANCQHIAGSGGQCQQYIANQIQLAIWDWSRFFKLDHPLFVLAWSMDTIPAHATNSPVWIKVSLQVCGETVADPVDACYIKKGYFADPEIVLTDIGNLRPSLIAHELGHVLVGNSHFSNSDMPSLMSDGSLVEQVQAVDVDWVCSKHPECLMRECLDVVWANEASELEY